LYTIHPKAKKILDIGSGRGLTLYFLKKYYGYQKTTGTQLCKSAAEHSRRVLGLEVYNKDFLKINFGKEKFDLISLWHILEHVNEPEKYIARTYSLLEKNGKLVIEVPNHDSWSRKLTGKYWLGMDLDYHLTFFSPESISILLKKYGFEIINIHTFSLEYSTFISVQSIVSRITETDQILFKWLQAKNGNSQAIFHLLLFIILMPLCLLINLLLYPSKSGEVLLVVGEKKKSLISGFVKS
jgi:SAM-dependent methyltransferase